MKHAVAKTTYCFPSVKIQVNHLSFFSFPSPFSFFSLFLSFFSFFLSFFFFFFLRYSMASTDYNPIHRSQTLAALAGLPGTIVHGMWSAANARRVLVQQVVHCPHLAPLQSAIPKISSLFFFLFSSSSLVRLAMATTHGCA